MARGGRRSGAPGKTYGNRKDLTPASNKQPVKVANDLPYGERQAREQAQQAVPLPAVTPINAPTARPTEPVTAGAPLGPGPGPQAVTGGGPVAPLDILAELYRLDPNEDLRRLIGMAERRVAPSPATPPAPLVGPPSRRFNPGSAPAPGPVPVRPTVAAPPVQPPPAALPAAPASPTPASTPPAAMSQTEPD